MKAYSSLTKYIGAGNLDKKGGPDAAKALRKFSAPGFDPPEIRKDESTEVAKVFYENDLKQYVEDKSTWVRVNKKIFNLMSTHCTPEMEMKLQSMKDWEKVEDDQDGLELAKLIRDILHQKDEKEQSALECVAADKALFLCYQKAHQTTAEYLETFKARVDVCKSTSSGVPGNSNTIAESIATSVGLDYGVLTDKDKKREIAAIAQKRYLSALLFAGLDDGRYAKLKNDVRNNWIVGRQDTVPTSYEGVMRMTDGYRSAGQTRHGGAGDGVAFAQAGRGRGNPRTGRGRGAGRGSGAQKGKTE
jgi:hypothetical protein